MKLNKNFLTHLQYIHHNEIHISNYEGLFETHLRQLGAAKEYLPYICSHSLTSMLSLSNSPYCVNSCWFEENNVLVVTLLEQISLLKGHRLEPRIFFYFHLQAHPSLKLDQLKELDEECWKSKENYNWTLDTQ